MIRIFLLLKTSICITSIEKQEDIDSLKDVKKNTWEEFLYRSTSLLPRRTSHFEEFIKTGLQLSYNYFREKPNCFELQNFNKKPNSFKETVILKTY